jgi:hypothetical protein
MPFEPEGCLKAPVPRNDNKPRKPADWPGGVYHHIIPWNVLREFWNILVANVMPIEPTKKKGKRYVGHQRKQMERYLKVVGFEENAHFVVAAIWDDKFRHLNSPITDDLDWRLCWQPFNLVRGPANRPGHAPDPGENADFPPMAPPNGFRAMELNRACAMMQAYIDSEGSVTQLEQALELLEDVAARYQDVVPEYDVNWYALRQDRFWSMTNVQRREFAEACMRQRGLADPEEIYELVVGPDD